jgi:hypothetical protein
MHQLVALLTDLSDSMHASAAHAHLVLDIIFILNHSDLRVTTVYGACGDWQSWLVTAETLGPEAQRAIHPCNHILQLFCM